MISANTGSSASADALPCGFQGGFAALAPQAGLLSGIRVVEAASMMLVPSVGAALADYGAQVI
jgi:hypothetical protein